MKTTKIQTQKTKPNKQINKKLSCFRLAFFLHSDWANFQIETMAFQKLNYLGNTGTDVLLAAETNPPLGRFYVGRGRVSETVVK